jgi:hypothetical protein
MTGQSGKQPYARMSTPQKTASRCKLLMTSLTAINGIMLPAVFQAVTLFGAWGEGLS